MRLQLLAVARSFRAIAACCHIAPAAAAILRVVEEHALAARIGTTTDARQLAEDERVGGRFDDRDHETRERVADRNERSHEGSVGAKIHATRPSAAAEDAIDLDEAIVANAFAHRTTLGER